MQTGAMSTSPEQTTGDPHYVVALHLPDERELEIGALGTFTFPADDYVYVGRASRGYDARLARHRRLADKSIRWHADYLREATRWIEARTPDAPDECALADRLASRPDAERFVDGFGASDCGCDGHLVRLEAPADDLPGPLWPGEGRRATFVERPNRFVVRAELSDGETASAYLPNTARLTELLVPGRELLLEPADDPSRSTDYTVRRLVDETLVALEAVGAETLIAQYLDRCGQFPRLGPVDDWTTQEDIGDYRVDFRLEHPDDSATWLEVKSLSRCIDGTAYLSGTPSRRAARQLDKLGDLVDRGERAAVAFVIQRGDPERLSLGDTDEVHVDDDWRKAIRRARQRGIEILAFRCRVTPSNTWLDERIPVVDP
jgi:sugar fermentation stimulation protein A